MKARIRTPHMERPSAPRAGTKKGPRALEKQREAEVEKRNRAALGLLEEWLADDTGYDERVWPELKKALEEDRPRARRLFGE